MSEQPDGPTYALYASFAADPARSLGPQQRQHAAASAESILAESEATVRGVYTISGYRADADMMLWLVGHSADAVQDALIAFRRTALGNSLLPVWSAIGVHREAEFAKSHMPAFMRGEPPCRYISVYPFVRSLEWYLLPEAERSAMLREHGEMGRSRPEVRANTVSAFALGDYEWLLAFECDAPPAKRGGAPPHARGDPLPHRPPAPAPRRRRRPALRAGSQRRRRVTATPARQSAPPAIPIAAGTSPSVAQLRAITSGGTR